MLYIDPDECMDCDACVPECPVAAIFRDSEVPSRWAGFVALNAERVSALKAGGGHIVEKQEAKRGPDCKG
jgi:ferredoxin